MAEPMRKLILDVAGSLFYSEGIRAVGVDKVIEKADVAKATLYRHFPSKEHLVEAYLQDRHENVIASMSSVQRRAEPMSPRESVLALFDMLHDKAETPQFRGCAFLLAVAEHGESARVVNVARTHKAAVKAIFAELVAPLGERGPALAEHLALLYEGALATVAVGRDPEAVVTARRCAAMLFD